MARVTVEDCLEHVENRFDLVLKAAARAHRLELGGVDPMVPEDNDKPTVIALREIAAGYDVTTVRVIEETVVVEETTEAAEGDAVAVAVATEVVEVDAAAEEASAEESIEIIASLLAEAEKSEQVADESVENAESVEDAESKKDDEPKVDGEDTEAS